MVSPGKGKRMSDEPATEAEEPETAEMDAKSLGEKIKEKVEAEASKYETEPEPEEPPEEEEEKAPDKIDPLTAALGRYVGEISQILGPEIPIIPCPYCQGKGFEPLLLEHDPHSVICPECKGYGQVATGSYVQGNEVRMCSHCNGAGYKPDAPVVATLPAAPDAEPLRVLTPEEVERIAADARAKVESFGA
jgi:hypothetical protein